MKAFVAALVVLIAGVSAWPQNEIAAPDNKSERIVADLIITVIEDLAQSIRDRGLDPYYLASAEGGYALPVPVIFTGSGSAEEIRLDGLSNIVVNDVTYGILSGLLTYDLSLPRLSGSVGAAAAEVIIFGNKITGSGKGSVVVSDLRVSGGARVSVSIISGVTISDATVVIELGGIQSEISLVVQEYDFSDYLNGFLNVTVPTVLEDFKDEIGELAAILIVRYINNLL